MSRFLTPIDKPFTRTVPLGPCECPGTPHAQDEAEVYTMLGWDDLVDIGSAPSEGAAQRLLTTRAIASWNLVELGADGTPRPVPVVEATVRLLNPQTLAAIAEAVNEAYERAREPLPNASSEASPPSSQATDTSTPTTPTPVKPTN